MSNSPPESPADPAPTQVDATKPAPAEPTLDSELMQEDGLDERSQGMGGCLEIASWLLPLVVQVALLLLVIAATFFLIVQIRQSSNQQLQVATAELNAASNDVSNVAKTLTDEEETFRQSAESAKQQIDALNAEVTELKRTLESYKTILKTPNIVDKIAPPESLKNLDNVVNQVQAIKTKSENLAVKMDLSDWTSRLEASVANKINMELNGNRTALERLTKGFDEFRQRLAYLENRERQAAQPEDLAIVLYHTKDLSAGHVGPVVQQLLNEKIRPSSHKNFRIGVYSASQSKLDVLHPLEAKSAATLSLSFNQAIDPNSKEVPQGLNLQRDVFAKSPPTASKRCLLVVSARCNPIDVNSADWKGITTDVVVMQSLQEDGNLILERIKLWYPFCFKHQGFVTHAVIPTKSPMQPQKPADTASLQRTLHRLIQPRKVPRS